MDVRREDSHLLLRLHRGEEVVATLQEWAGGEAFGHARVHGIGALQDLTLGWFDVETREYRRRDLNGSWEMLDLQGNLARVDGAPFLHAHVVVGGPQMEVRGGHLFAGTVSVTAELFVIPGRAALERRQDEATGLKLWDLGS